jgi:hypothetical protein
MKVFVHHKQPASQVVEKMCTAFALSQPQKMSTSLANAISKVFHYV